MSPTYSNLGANLGEPAYLIDGETIICSVTSFSSGLFFSAPPASRLPDDTPPTIDVSVSQPRITPVTQLMNRNPSVVHHRTTLANPASVIAGHFHISILTIFLYLYVIRNLLNFCNKKVSSLRNCIFCHDTYGCCTLYPGSNEY